MKNLFCILVLLTSINMFGLTPFQEKALKALHYIHFGDTGCSAYAVGAHSLMTAEHCFLANSDFTIDDNNNTIDDKNNTTTNDILIRARKNTKNKINTKNTKNKTSDIKFIIMDNNDHIILIIPDYTFDNVITLKFKNPAVADHVFMFGNPLAIEDTFNQYREGYMSGKGDDDGHVLNLFVMPAIPGDSGSCIFDEQGNILGIVSIRNGPFMGSFPITFSAEQIKQVQ